MANIPVILDSQQINQDFTAMKKNVTVVDDNRFYSQHPSNDDHDESAIHPIIYQGDEEAIIMRNGTEGNDDSFLELESRTQ